MTTEEAPDILVYRQNMARVTGVPIGNIGTRPDARHLSGGGYHVGAEDLAKINAVGNDDYSIRQPRDRAQYNFDRAHGLSFSAAIDMDDDWPIGGRAAWIRWNNLIRHYAGRNHPSLVALRGMNYTPDGTTKRRFDCLTDTEGSTSDTVTWHTHLEQWRDLRGKDQARWTYAFLVGLAQAAIKYPTVQAAIAAIDGGQVPQTQVEAISMSSEATFFSAIGDTSKPTKVFYGIPGVSCVWVKPPTPTGDYKAGSIYKSIADLVSVKWIEAPYQTVNHGLGSAPAIDRALIRISGELPDDSWKDCALVPVSTVTANVDVNDLAAAIVASPALAQLIHDQSFTAAQEAESK